MIHILCMCSVIAAVYMIKVWKNLHDTVNVVVCKYYSDLDANGNIVNFKLPE